MQKQVEQVLQFHRAVDSHVPAGPTALADTSIPEGRANLLAEELEEYRQACRDGDPVAVADALTDQLYVLLGTFISHGMHEIAARLFDEVHRSNMSKLGPDGKPLLRADGKVLKGPHFSPPDLGAVLAENG